MTSEAGKPGCETDGAHLQQQLDKAARLMLGH
jgi:hypothetical protein